MGFILTHSVYMRICAYMYSNGKIKTLLFLKKTIAIKKLMAIIDSVSYFITYLMEVLKMKDFKKMYVVKVKALGKRFFYNDYFIGNGHDRKKTLKNLSKKSLIDYAFKTIETAQRHIERAVSYSGPHGYLVEYEVITLEEALTTKMNNGNVNKEKDICFTFAM